MAPFPQDALGRGRAALPGAFPAVPAWKIPVSFPQIPLLPSPAAPPGAPAAPARQSRVLRAGTASPGAREKLLAPGKALEWEVSEGEKNSGLRRADPGSRGRDGSVGSFPRSGCAWGGGERIPARLPIPKNSRECGVEGAGAKLARPQSAPEAPGFGNSARAPCFGCPSTGREEEEEEFHADSSHPKNPHPFLPGLSIHP